jgi:hypothetical protein
MVTIGPPRRTVLGDPPWVTALVWLLLPAVGAGLGWFLPVAVDWLTALNWLPLPGPVELLTNLPRVRTRLGLAVAGAVTGLVLAFLAAQDTLRVVVGDDAVTLSRGDSTRAIPRAAVAAVYAEDHRLVLLDRAGRELARERYDLGGARFAEGFTGHGWPWRADGDPYRDDYRRWVPDLPDLPPAADALFAARQRALTRGDREEADSLRAELARLGVVARDDDKRQLWRRVAD